jgi:hypothetical protein
MVIWPGDVLRVVGLGGTVVLAFLAALVSLRGAGTGVKMAGGTARDVVVSWCG